MEVEGILVAKQASAGTPPSNNIAFTLALAPGGNYNNVMMDLL